jgi:hypothetical protein
MRSQQNIQGPQIILNHAMLHNTWSVILLDTASHTLHVEYLRIPPGSPLSPPPPPLKIVCRTLL